MSKAKRGTVLVTGAGFVGVHACKTLSEAGYQPVVYDKFVYGHEELGAGVRWSAATSPTGAGLTRRLSGTGRTLSAFRGLHRGR